MIPLTAAVSRPAEVEQIAQQHAPLVGGLLVDGAQPPAFDQLSGFESAYRDIGITCVQR